MAVSGPSAPPGHDHTGGQSQRRKSLLVGEAGGDSPPANPSLAPVTMLHAEKYFWTHSHDIL